MAAHSEFRDNSISYSGRHEKEMIHTRMYPKEVGRQRRVLTKAKLLRNGMKVRAIRSEPSIDLNRGDAMVKVSTSTCEASDLAFAHWQQCANEKAYEAKLITKAMYEFARDEIHKTTALLSEVRYNV